MTPLHIVADRHNVEFARALLDAGASVDPINVWGNTPLWTAIMKQSRTSAGWLDGPVPARPRRRPQPHGGQELPARDDSADRRLPRRPHRTDRAEGEGAVVITRFEDVAELAGVAR
ncbi:ankyrin repeat domain-containing protein [Mycolicibacterium goodii]|uniref:ankyrin repeat domain-containing protein n=1 Tax=Mycolicibacterium goodii TaxID=134601 RepID=UPI0035573A1D